MTVEFAFGKKAAATQMKIEISDPEHTRDSARFFYPYKEQGPVYLRGSFAYFSLSLPAPTEPVPVRLHVAVRYIEMSDLQRGVGIKYRQDFDRCMDIVQQIAAEMVDANVLRPGALPVEIVAEPLGPTRRLRLGSAEDMSVAIGSSWLNHPQLQQHIFSGFYIWDATRSMWGEL